MKWGMEMRITHLDGLRGLAILLVVVYHLFARWAELVPWGDSTAVPIVRTGYHGVELFFLISGFVILMTLERSPNLFSFAWRRWLRLFPAMLICSALIFATAWLIPDRPGGSAEQFNRIQRVYEQAVSSL